MGNYKPVHLINSVNIGGVETSLSKNTKILILFFDFGGGTTPKSLFNVSTNLVYQVPSGKTFQCLGVRIVQIATQGNLTISTGDTQDAETATKASFQMPAIVGITEFPLDITFDATKFITADEDTVTINTLWMLGYET